MPSTVRPLVIDNNTRELARRVVQYAKRNRFTMRHMFDVMAHPERKAGADANHILIIPFGFKVVYSLEEQSRIGWCHHISISVDTPGNFPSVEAVNEIIKLFGLQPPFTKTALSTWIEDEGQAINLLFLKTK